MTTKYVAILGQGVAGLARYGITKETLAPGTKVTLYGYPPKASGGATKGILVNAMTLPDGKRSSWVIRAWVWEPLRRLQARSSRQPSLPVSEGCHQRGRMGC